MPTPLPATLEQGMAAGGAVARKRAGLGLALLQEASPSSAAYGSRAGRFHRPVEGKSKPAGGGMVAHAGQMAAPDQLTSRRRGLRSPAASTKARQERQAPGGFSASRP